MKRRTQIVNLAQLLLAPLPAYLLSRYLLGGGEISLPSFFSFSSSGIIKNATTTKSISASSLSPFALANLLLALSLLLGWLASLLQESTWLIDPYWTLVPPLLDALYSRACPGGGSSGSSSGRLLSSFSLANQDPRAAAATLLLLLWSLRLTHSYFRRERWRLGAREDWRYAQMRADWGRHWWWWQLVPVYLVQHFLLAGLALPSFALRCCSGGKSSPSAFWGCLSSCALPSSLPRPALPWHPLLDSLAVAAALAGLLLAGAADSQLHAFVSAREEGRRRGERASVLESGLWALSRHPNYLGETVFHVSLAALAVSGRYFASSSARNNASLLSLLSVLWPLAGAALNTACLVAVTRMTEARTAAARGRRKAWESYCSRVPCWVPRLGPLVRKLLMSGGEAKKVKGKSSRG